MPELSARAFLYMRSVLLRNCHYNSVFAEGNLEMSFFCRIFALDFKRKNQQSIQNNRAFTGASRSNLGGTSEEYRILHHPIYTMYISRDFEFYTST